MKYAFILAGILVAALFFANPPLVVEKTNLPAPDTAQQTEDASEISNTPTGVQDYTWYPVVKVVDGDTITISMNGKNVTLRLIGLDTPETVDPRKPVQCFGKEASEKMKQLLSGNSVRLEKDPSQGDLDKYGRLLAYVYTEAIFINQYVIAEGYGHEYTYNLPYKYQAAFKEAERLAREQKKGLWADDACNTMTSSASAAVPQSGEYECSRNTYNCSSFTTQIEAQAVFDSCGGNGNDIHKLDSDSDGRVCESLP